MIMYRNLNPGLDCGAATGLWCSGKMQCPVRLREGSGFASGNLSASLTMEEISKLFFSYLILFNLFINLF